MIVKTGLLLLFYAAACYPFILKLVPALTQAKYSLFIIGTVVIFGLLIAGCHLLYWNIFPLINGLLGSPSPARFRTRYWPAVNLGLINGGKVIVAATTLTYLRHWWNKTMESERLMQENAQAELRSLRAQINPHFLISSLNTVHDHAVLGSGKSSELLLKLADLLSYSLYECNSPQVPVWKEVQMMRDYIEIEKSRLGDKFEAELNISGDVSTKYTAPFLLLPIVENGIRQSSAHEDCAWLNMDLGMDKNDMLMTLTFGNSVPEDEDVMETRALDQLKKRLDILYPNSHELKLTRQEEMAIIQLKIRLDEQPGSENDINQAFSLSII
jgi:hypothetical protein